MAVKRALTEVHRSDMRLKTLSLAPWTSKHKRGVSGVIDGKLRGTVNNGSPMIESFLRVPVKKEKVESKKLFCQATKFIVDPIYHILLLVAPATLPVG